MANLCTRNSARPPRSAGRSTETWQAQSTIQNGLPSPGESDRSVEKLRVHLTSLKAQSQLLPVEGGRPNIGAIARAAGVPLSASYVDSVKRLFVELMGVSINGSGRPRGSSRVHEQPDSPGLLQLEQQLARAEAETDELSRQLAIVEETLNTK